MNFYCIDFESNGAVNGLEPIEFAWVEICSQSGKIGQFHEYGFSAVRGGRQLSDHKNKVPNMRDLWTTISQNLHGKVLCGHNVSHDFSILNKTFPGFTSGGLIDTLTIYRQLYGRQIKNYSLEDLLNVFDLSKTLDDLALNDHFVPHRALYDAYGCALLIQRLIEDPKTANIFHKETQQKLF